MSRETFRAALSPELDVLWPAARAAHVFPGRDEFERFHAEEPWRVRVGDKGSAAILERWREHLDILAMRAIWASSGSLVDAIADLRTLAGDRGFSRLLSPLVVQEARGPYLRAGFEQIERLVAYRVPASDVADRAPAAPEGVRLRVAEARDLAAIDEIDRGCFEPFWAYGPGRLSALLATEIVTVAESSDGVIGYTLSTIERGSGTLGRIAVSADHRGRGIGSALLGGSMRALVRSGAGSIGLCAREANTTARAMYRAAGMRELPGKLVFLSGETARD